MIETVIGTDGTKEPFIASKLNNWIKGVTGDQWRSIVQETIKDLPEEVPVTTLMQRLIDSLLGHNTWTHYLQAGKINAILMRIQIFGSKTPPKVREVHEKLAAVRLLKPMNYSDYEWDIIESAMRHDRDLESPHFALEHLRHKYALKDHGKGLEFETPQFIYMRMAMAVFQSVAVSPEIAPIFTKDTSQRTRIEHVIALYEFYSKKMLSAPTPNYNNLGTYHQGFASCCLIYSFDDRFSLAVGEHITYMMTTQSAGIGNNRDTRSLGDPVQGGRFLHRGRIPYIGTFGKNIRANLQGGRGGAGTDYTSLYDPEARVVMGLRDPRASGSASNRDAHYAYMTNAHITMKMAKGEDMFTWNIHTAPDLHKAFYGPDVYEFARIYDKYEKDPLFKKNYVDARALVVHSINQGIMTGTIYGATMCEINRHTPFIDAIHSSNLCLEIAEPTSPYVGRKAMMDLYSEVEVGHANFSAVAVESKMGKLYEMRASSVMKHTAGGTKFICQDVKVGDIFDDKNLGEMVVTKVHSVKREPEVATCSLGSINVTEEIPNEVYRELMYYGYRVIDYCITENDYILPHIGVTAKARMNAAIGMMGVATHMARRRLKYTSKEGLQELHKLAERHMYYAIEASLAISKERGVAPWIERTKWPEGWNPKVTYKRSVDSLADFVNYFDFDEQSQRVIANGGIAHSCLVAYMPGEASSKALAATNSYMPIRRLIMIKVDSGIALRWAAPYGDDPAYLYESVWDSNFLHQNAWAAILIKLCDQAVSADWYKNFSKTVTISSTEIIEAEINRVHLGVKTRYYINTLMPGDNESMQVSTSAVAGFMNEGYSAANDNALAGIVFADEREECEGCSS